eukprot:1161645-Pelagomonas_calceolata.AAC.30
MKKVQGCQLLEGRCCSNSEGCVNRRDASATTGVSEQSRLDRCKSEVLMGSCKALVLRAIFGLCFRRKDIRRTIQRASQQALCKCTTHTHARAHTHAHAHTPLQRA